jgi:hypothetical protein
MIDWVELLYSLHAAGCINRGQITLKELFQQMGEVFGFEVTEFSNYFMNIKNRKDKNRTKFMDSMRAAILEVMIASDRKPSWK